MITGNHAQGRYFDTDLRSVRPEGVAHVMSLFMKHYASDAASARSAALRDEETDRETAAVMRQAEAVAAVMCDEEALARA